MINYQRINMSKNNLWNWINNPHILVKENDARFLYFDWKDIEEIEDEMCINVRDIIEKDAINRNTIAFMNNMFQMIENWISNYELWIWENKHKFNEKVRNFINKSDEELLELWISIENIIKVRVMINVKNLFNDIYSTLIEWKTNKIIEYLLQDKVVYEELWFSFIDIDILSYLKNLKDWNYDKIIIYFKDREKLLSIKK